MKTFTSRQIALVVLLLGATLCRATPQTPDILAIEGKVHKVFGFWLPPEMGKALDEFESAASLRKNGDTYTSSIRTSTANARGFYAELEISDGMLYLVRLRILNPWGTDARDDKLEIPFRIFVKGVSVPKKLSADWFTGDLKEYYGEKIVYSHISDRARVFTFRDGRLTGTDDVEPPEAKELRAKRDAQLGT